MADSAVPDIFDEVQAGEAAFGVVPFENSTHGPVTFTLNSLADRHERIARNRGVSGRSGGQGG